MAHAAAESSNERRDIAERALGGGFEQSYNAQAAVDTATMLVITAHVTQAPNDKREMAPALDKL